LKWEVVKLVVRLEFGRQISRKIVEIPVWILNWKCTCIQSCCLTLSIKPWSIKERLNPCSKLSRLFECHLGHVTETMKIWWHLSNGVITSWSWDGSLPSYSSHQACINHSSSPINFLSQTIIMAVALFFSMDQLQPA
jgi:hypothetical protein